MVNRAMIEKIATIMKNFTKNKLDSVTDWILLLVGKCFTDDIVRALLIMGTPK